MVSEKNAIHVKGHYSRECPTNGKGKGKGWDVKGKGKGKSEWGKGSGWEMGKGNWEMGKGSTWGGKGNGKSNDTYHKGKGEAKGQSGKAPLNGGCFTCGGPHFARDCPGAGQGGGTEIRSLCCLSQFQALVQEEEDEPELVLLADEQLKEAQAVAGDDDLSSCIGEEGEDQMTSQPWSNIVRRKSKRKRTWRKWKPDNLSMLGTVVPEGVNMINASGDWEELEMAVDSGATETVIGEDMVSSVDLKEGEPFKRGVQYEVASGTLIPNLGEKRFIAVGEEGEQRKMTVQVCEVNKALLSVSNVVSAGYRVVFEQGGSYVEDCATGERMYLKEVGGMYMMKLWIKKGF